MIEAIINPHCDPEKGGVKFNIVKTAWPTSVSRKVTTLEI